MKSKIIKTKNTNKLNLYIEAKIFFDNKILNNADMLIEKLGGDSMAEIMPRFQALRQARLEDLPMDDHLFKWWE